MDLRQLHVVVAIVEQGSVTQAAARLHLSPSAVSHTLAQLERELGVELFRRRSTGMTLTDAGAALIGPARRTLHEAKVARASVDEVRGVVSGHVKIVAVRAFTVPLASLIGAFAEHYPGVVVQVGTPEGESDVARMVLSGVAELGVLRAGVAPDGLVATPLAEERIVAVVPVGHALATCSRVGVAQLGAHGLVAPAAESVARREFDEVFRLYGTEPLVVAEAATHEMVLELVRAGVGSTLASEPSTSSVVGRGAVVVPIAGLGPATLHLVHRDDQPLTPAARAFVRQVSNRPSDR